jgi:hypothetical protein
MDALATATTRRLTQRGSHGADFAALPAVFSYGQARGAGLSQRRIYSLRDQGLVEVLARGMYRRTDIKIKADPDLVEIAIRAPQATVSLASALARCGLTDEIPHAIDIAIARGTRRPPTAAPINWHAFDPSTFDVGRDSLPLIDGGCIGLYGPERSIIDAFRLRHREGADLANNALKAWLRRPNASPATLTQMATNFPKALPALRAALEILL